MRIQAVHEVSTREYGSTVVWHMRQEDGQLMGRDVQDV